MGIFVNTNNASINTQRSLDKATESMSGTYQRLSSGLRINSAKDDAAGQAISTRFTAQIRGLEQARRNANDAISLSQVAEGALDQQTQMLQRIRELAVQSATGSNSSSDRAAINAEVQQLKEEITRIAEVTAFNGIEILNGNFASGKSFHVGSQSANESNQTISFEVSDMRADAIGKEAFFNLTDAQNANVVTSGNTLGGLAATDLTTAKADMQFQRAGVAVGQKFSMVDGDSAQQIAKNINEANGGVVATAKTQVVVNLAGFTAAAGDLKLKVSESVNGLNGAEKANFDISGFKTDDAGKLTEMRSELEQLGADYAFDLSADGETLTITNNTGKNLMFEVDAANAKQLVIEGETIAATTAGAVAVRGEVDLNATHDTTLTGLGATAKENALGLGNANDVRISTASSTSLGGIDVESQASANQAISIVDKAIATINDTRANLGAVQNRFQATVSGLATTTENLYASRSRILDADFAKETADLAKNSILQQASTAMLAQANQSGQLALQLLG